MSRLPLGVIIAAIILVFTGAAYYVTTSELTRQARSDVRMRVEQAQQQLTQSALLEGLSILKQVEVLATDGDFAIALAAETDGKRRALAKEAFERFNDSRGQGEDTTELMWLLDRKGRVAAQFGINNPLESEFMENDKIVYRAIELALDDGVITSDVWNHETIKLMRAGVAPIANAETGERVGAIIIGFPLTVKQARIQQRILGAEVAYFHNDSIFATSFTRNAGEEDVEMQGWLNAVLAIDNLGAAALQRNTVVVSASVGGSDYLVTALRLPRFTTSERWPEDYPAYATGAVVVMSLSEAQSSLGMVKWALILLGLSAFILALLGIAVTSRRILQQADEIEDGINDIIDGNLERSIRPVGADLDGLAHAVNVMLARLLGRPEPGDEEYDDYGNLVSASRVDFDNEELSSLSPADERSMKLAQESEPEYYSRVFGEYVDARQAAGESTDSITYENFVAKLRLNEAKLKVKYQCSAVRFRVDVKDGKVNLKPVPIV